MFLRLRGAARALQVML